MQKNVSVEFIHVHWGKFISHMQPLGMVYFTNGALVYYKQWSEAQVGDHPIQ